jgi:maltose alpha-D-glucosyltransferase / alpha-amylase
MDSKMIDKPLWYKQAIIYQIHIKGFYDDNCDGIGDFTGLTEKLGYLESLGITAIWLLPFYPSPLKDDGYDIADYYDVNPAYGTLNDFRRFLREAHARGIRVITELVINHTSDQHPWFQRARNAKPGSAWRNFYVWSNTTDKYRDARIIFQDFETSNWAWDAIAKAYYWHRFYSHQPDLNFESPLVQKEVLRALDFWFEMGVDGLRLDAIPYLFEKEGTNCENLPATHQFIKKLRKHMDLKFQDRILIAEANQWPEDAVAYFGEEDECQMAFHFPVMPRLFMAIHMEDRFPIIDVLEQTPQLPSTCQWVMFLRNHDELTLEMVSDEERDYMYRIYAQDPKARINLGIRRRLASLLDNDRAKIELMNILLFSLPGTPVIYYGDEIGMGDNYYLGDRNGVRTPMQWCPDRNAGFSSVNPQQLYLPVIIDPSYHYEVVNVENQQRNPSSLFWWIRRTLQVRKNHQAFGSGSLEFISSNNSKILAFTRTYDDETILVIANLSRFSQAAELHLSKYIGIVPLELYHHTRFPTIKEKEYNVTIGPHGYFWLLLPPIQNRNPLTQEKSTPKIRVDNHWETVFKDPYRRRLEKEIFPQFLKKVRWFQRKMATIQQIKWVETIHLDESRLCILEIRYLETEEVDTYVLPIAYSPKTEPDHILIKIPQSIIANLKVGDEEGYLYDGIYSKHLQQALLQFILKRKKMKFDGNELIAYAGKNIKKTEISLSDQILSVVLEGEQTNSAIRFEDRFFLKLYRRLEEGINPEVEVQKFISEKTTFKNIPTFEGKIEWQRPHKELSAIAILESVVANEGTCWDFTLEVLASFYERLLSSKDNDIQKMPLTAPLNTLQPRLEELIGGRYLEAARLLGQRTAEMHLALASNLEDREFRPEPFLLLYQRSLYHTMRSSTRATFQLLEKNLPSIPSQSQDIVKEVLKTEASLLAYYQQIYQTKISGLKIRIHGDYHLGQVLYTGKDFYIIDFEGEPLQPISQRRFKRSPLTDVAGMLRSFHYAAHQVLLSNTVIRAEMIPILEPWADLWYEHISHLFLESYMLTISKNPIHLVSNEQNENATLLKIFLLNKAIYEIKYELQTRPDWITVPCKGLLYCLKHTINLSQS